MRCPVSLLLVCVTGSALGAEDSPAETALSDYVSQADTSYSWRLQERFEVDGADVAQIILQSQTWQSTVWKHQLFIIRPRVLDPHSKQGLLVIGGGRWNDSYEDESLGALPEESSIFIAMANRLGSIVAVVGQVPFQPMFGLREDELIAYTFDEFVESGDAEWPLLLPMVKSAVRAMDTAQDFAAREWAAEIEDFTVLGGSKRGWTTWLTGVVEPRAVTLVPIVIDALNFAAHMPYQTTIWGAPSHELAPYTERGLVNLLSEEAGAGADLRTIVDPYSYRERLTQLKLIVVATNDAFFPLDSLNLYWDDLPSPKYVLYLPNSTHSVDDFGRLIPALNAVHGGAALPFLDWEFETLGEQIRLCIRAEPTPAAIRIWVANSADTDFRDSTFVPTTVSPRDDVVIVDVDPSADGYKALFGEVLFTGDDNDIYPLSTNVRLIDSKGQPASTATAIDGTEGICP